MPELGPKQVQRLHEAISQSNRRMEDFRKRRVEALDQFVGAHYGGRKRGKKVVPINIIYTGASVYVPNLVARHPAFRVRTGVAPLRPFANTFELALTRFTQKKIQLKKILRQIVFDSIFGYGIAKCGLMHSGQNIQMIDGEAVDVGEMAVTRVDQDDYIVDTFARDREEVQFEGNRMRVPLDWAKEVFDNSDGLSATEVELGKQDEAKKESQSGGHQTVEFEESTEVYEIFLPRQNLLVTLPTQGQGQLPLKETEWQGRPRGPFRMLGYTYVSDNLIPLAPVSAWMDLHEMINTLTRKLKRQTERHKKILAYEDRAAEDVQRIVGADDGETVKVTDAKAFAEIEFGGKTPFQEQFLQWLIQMASRAQGNVDLLGGLASRARSATEASFVQGNAAVRVTDMRDAVYTFAGELGEEVAFYMASDPVLEMLLEKSIPETDIVVQSLFSAKNFQGDFDDYDFSVQAYSMKPTDPEEYAKSLMEWWGSVVLPTMQIAIAQGAVPNIPAFVRLMAKEMGIKEVDQLYQGGMPMPELLGGGGGSTAPAQRSMGGGGGGQQNRAAYYVQQVAQGAQQGAPKPQAPNSQPYRSV